MAQGTLSVHSPEEAAEPVVERRAGGRGWHRLAAAAAIVVLTLLWFAPAIVARTHLRNRLVHAALPQFPGTASVGEASLGWLVPIRLCQVSLSDTTGSELARIEEFRTSRTLVALVFARDADLGKLTFVRPRLSVRLRRDGSNLEDSLGPLLASEGAAAAMMVAVESGEARWTTTDGADSPGGLTEITGSIRFGAGRTSPAQADVSAMLSDGERRAPIKVELRANGADEAGTEVAAGMRDAPLASLGPWLHRFGIDGEIVGSLSAELVASRRSESSGWNFDGSLEGCRLRWRIAGADDLTLESVSIKGRGLATQERWQIEELVCDSDFGNVKGRAGVTLREPPAVEEWKSFAKWLLHQEVLLTGTVDLARLAASLPQSFPQADAIESGRLEASLRITERESRRAGILEIRTTDLVSGPEGRRVVWRRPLEAKLHVSCDSGGFRLERLEATSAGIQVAGSGSTAGGELSFEADLDQLREQAALFVPVSAGALGGKASGAVRLRPSAEEGVFAFEATGTARGLAVGGSRWGESDLVLEARGELVARGAAPQSIRSGTVTLRSGDGDKLVGTITAPVRFAEGNWAASATLDGDLARWTARLRAAGVSPFPEGWQLSGSAAAAAEIASQAGLVRIGTLRVEAREVRVRAPAFSLDEPRVAVSGNATWNGDLLTIPTAKIACETISLEVREGRMSSGGESPSGRITFRGGIGRLARFAMPPRPPVWLSGVIAGTVDFVADGPESEVTAALVLERPTLSRAVASPGSAMGWSRVWSDERCDVALAGRHRADALEVQSFSFKGSGLAMRGTGRVDALASSCVVDLTGVLECDAERLRDRLDVAMPEGLRWSGGGARPFLLRGPLLAGKGGIDPTLVARAGLAWDQLGLFGVEIGKGELSMSLTNRTLRLEPFDWPVAGGRVRGSATASLSRPAIVQIPPGRIADSIDLTPQICAQWLRYAAPALADVAEIQGSGSIDIGSCALLPYEVARSEAEGVLALEGVEATPGPFTRSLVEIVRQVQTVAGTDATDGSDLRLVAPKQDVRVRLRNGRVFHDRFVVRLGDADGTIVATSGSVGLDQSLDLVAEFPLSREWFKDERVAAAFGGQVLRVPVRGTLTNPVPDPRALQDLARRAATGAIGGLLEREIDRQLGDPLNKLFDRTRP